nr:phosphotransferase [Ornithinimicrobium sp. F0845]
MPDAVRAWVADEVGGVLEVLPQQGGFSPGVADRVHGERRWAFVKAVGEGLNQEAPDLLAQEVGVLGQLPQYVGAPVLLASLDERINGERWVGLLVEDIPGRHPHTPWVEAEANATLEELARVAARPLPGDVELPLLEDFMGRGTLAHWPDVLADPPADLDPWVAANADRLSAVAGIAGGRLSGDYLVHNDVRADNLLVTPEGRVRVVDWPFACRGAAWVDTLMLVLNLRLYGTPGHTSYDARMHALGATEEDVDAVLAGILAYFVHKSRLPAPPGLPTLREFQRVQGVATAAWLRERWEGAGPPSAAQPSRTGA